MTYVVITAFLLIIVLELIKAWDIKRPNATREEINRAHSGCDALVNLIAFSMVVGLITVLLT